jgi:predicted RNA methylase
VVSWLSRAGTHRSPGSGLTDPVHTTIDRLADADRTAKLIDAIDEAVAPGCRVVQLGVGSGLLALAAARAGAALVDAYEWDAETAAQARRNVTANGLASVVQVIEDDVRTAPFSGPYDVVIADLVTVGLASGPLVPGLNHLIARRALSPEVRVVPSSQSTFVELVEVDDEHHGFRLPMPHIERTWHPRRLRETMTALRLVSHPDLEEAARLGELLSELVVAIIDVDIRHTGLVNAIRLTSMSHLAPGLDSGWTSSANDPLLVPVPPQEVTVGAEVGIELSWHMGAGATSVSFAWRDTDPGTNPD